MPSADRLLLLLIASGTLAAAPATALARQDQPAPAPQTSGDAQDAVDPALADPSAGDTTVGDTTDDPFCDTTTTGDAVDATGDNSGDATDPSGDPADSSTDASGAGPVDTGAFDPAAYGSFDDPSTDPTADNAGDDPSAEDPVDFCGAGDPLAAAPANRATRRVVVPRSAFHGRGHLSFGTVSVPAAGTITETVTGAPAKAAIRSARAARTATLAVGHRTVAGKQVVSVPLHLTKLGRRSLANAGHGVRVTLHTTMRLRSGQTRVRTQVVELRAAKR